MPQSMNPNDFGDILAFHIVIQLVKDFTSVGEISKRL